ncbi:extracellular solute-binding protein [Candidatus Daviesbacteria bacterium]|nr:extracellular solute-binding protein [Candidatus Daviesbacteria bacterium]
MKKIIIAVVVLAIIIGILFWKFGYLLTAKKTAEPVTLKLWGLWEDDSLVRPAIDGYTKLHPNVKIEYNHQNSPNYRTRVQTQIEDSKGPDIFMIHNSWLPMFLKNSNLASLPTTVMTSQEYNQTFYPIAFASFAKNNTIYALPLEVDGLALYYNEDLINQAGVAIPKNWDEFVDAAVKLTKKDDKGNILVAGAAMGAVSNVDHFSDIIGLLFYQQPDADLEHPNNLAGADVIKFYTNFILDPSKKVWSLAMEGSTQAFYEGKLAFYFAPSWRAHDLRVANPQLHFKTAPVPQLPKANTANYSGWGTFWGFAVSSKSSHQDQAWDFLKFLTSKDSEKLLYSEASKIRLFGQPYSRIDLQSELLNDPIVGSFVSQAPIYKNWYLSSRTFDQGLNDEMITYFENAINATLQGANPLGALQTTAQGVQQTLDKFVNNKPSPSPTSNKI